MVDTAGYWHGPGRVRRQMPAADKGGKVQDRHRPDRMVAVQAVAAVDQQPCVPVAEHRGAPGRSQTTADRQEDTGSRK